MYPAKYVRPLSARQASLFLHENPQARPLSGGMTLIPTLKQRLASPTHLVDISQLEELRGIALSDGVLRVGAATRHAEIAASALVRHRLPALAQLAGGIGDPQVRNRGTIGGSVANNDPAADFPAAVLGTGATVITTERAITADQFFVGMFQTALQAHELIVAVEFPLPAQARYEKFRHPASGFALVGVFVARGAQQVRLAVTGAAPCVFRWHDAEQALMKSFHPGALDGLVLDPDTLMGDVHASAPYRAHLVQHFARCAVAEAAGSHNELS